MIYKNDLIQVMVGRCEDNDLCDWIEEHGYPIIRITHIEDSNLWGETFETGEQVPYHMEVQDVEFYGRYGDTVKAYIEQLKQFPLETIISVEDMEGNTVYPECSFADHTDCDIPKAELLLPIYLKSIAIEPESENDVFLNDDVKVWNDDVTGVTIKDLTNE